MSSGDAVTRAVEAWRALLARPWAEAFLTDTEFTRRLITEAHRIARRTLTRSPSRRSRFVPIIPVHSWFRVPDDLRAYLLRHPGVDLFIGVVRLAPALAPILVPREFVVSRPVSTTEREQVTTRQVEILQAFSAKVTQSRSILERLTARGADPAYVLAALLRYTARRSTEFPASLAIDFRQAPLTVTLPPRARRIGRGAVVLPTTVSWVLPLTPAPPSRRRRGPAETVTSVGMTVLAHYLRASTGRVHAREVGELFGVWGGSSYAVRQVGERRREIRKRYPRQLHRLLRDEGIWQRACSALR